MSWLDILEYDRYGPDKECNDTFICRCCNGEFELKDMSIDLDLCKNCLDQDYEEQLDRQKHDDKLKELREKEL